jgi:hypothetical protein
MPTTIQYCDRLGHRSRHSRLILFDQKNSIMFEFKGSNIDGIATVLNEEYEKNGKWSNSTYTLRLRDGVQSYHITQSWEEGEYLPENTWEDAFTQFKARSEFFELTMPVFEAYVRAYMSNAAARFDKTAAALEADDTAFVQAERNLQAAKAALASEIRKAEQAAEAEVMNKKASGVFDALKKGGLSLEELRELAERL